MDSKTVESVYKDVWLPAMQLLPANMKSSKADVIGMTIGLQESLLKFRHQIGGPAHGLWQFEKGGGVRGVLTHRASAGLAKEIQLDRGHGTGVNAAYDALEHDDVFAAVFARLLMWTDPFPLAEVDQVQRAWKFYERTWRPGKPHPSKWPANHKLIRDTLKI